MEFPDPEYVKTEDGAYIAYLVVGDGPVDIAWQSDFGAISTSGGSPDGIRRGSKDSRRSGG